MDNSFKVFLREHHLDFGNRSQLKETAFNNSTNLLIETQIGIKNDTKIFDAVMSI